MFTLTPLERIDYLVVGHLTRDITPEGPRLGGTAAYSALTARALGLRVGIVTAWANDVAIENLQAIPMVNYPSDITTTFENIYTEEGRIQYLRSQAANLEYYAIPEPWRNAAIVHLGPVAGEVNPTMVRHFPNSLIGLTPQGWMREWDRSGKVRPAEWPEASFTMARAGAVIISVEDVGGDEERIAELATYCPILAVTEGPAGSRLYWHGDVRRFRAPVVPEADATGAGDVYAAAFLSRLYTTRDPWESARFATQLASLSVTRQGLDKTPTFDEIQQCTLEVLR
jgi:sugar/nucleoside kinase (ribokinase family)